jgi:hypothetical protein
MNLFRRWFKTFPATPPSTFTKVSADKLLTHLRRGFRLRQATPDKSAGKLLTAL